MWHGMAGWWDNGWGGGLAFGVAHLLWWAALIVAVVLIVRWLGGDRRNRHGPAPQDRALSILKERYARGEIDKAEFDAKRRDLE